MKTKLTNLSDTKALAEKIAAKVQIGDVVELRGDLGAGKTTFANYFINSFFDTEREVLSPTFNLVYPYETPDFTIYHFDLYRIEDPSEVEHIGIYDAFDEGVSLIEWPEIISDMLPKDRLLININIKNDEREAVIEGFGRFENERT